ncbi:PilN domain-containing protein [Nitrosomonas sp. HPC101]|uniref:PilN domain-containing protein n=1 Tax=Nitrosomonas sp. HPC101 TaxID=1658667 RepID=UPI0013DE395C|nr:PilN domain-containing protein [Nitrosomonas sp. HPC101]
MRSLKLNFPYRRQQMPLVDYLLLFLGVVVALTVIYTLKQTMSKITYWEVREARIVQQQKHDRQPRTPIVRINKATQQEFKRADDILRQLNLPWEALFDALELAASEQIALLSLQPSVSGQTIRITGEARDLGALVEYVQALELGPVLKNVHLASYKTRQDHPRHPIVFSVVATWHESL